MQYLFADRVCEGILNVTSGFIVPPDLDGDGQYDSLLRCNWLIVALEDKLIEFQILYVDIKGTQFQICAEELVVSKFKMSLCVRKPTIWVPTRSDTNRAVQSQKMV